METVAICYRVNGDLIFEILISKRLRVAISTASFVASLSPSNPPGTTRVPSNVLRDFEVHDFTPRDDTGHELTSANLVKRAWQQASHSLLIQSPTSTPTHGCTVIGTCNHPTAGTCPACKIEQMSQSKSRRQAGKTPLPFPSNRIQDRKRKIK